MAVSGAFREPGKGRNGKAGGREGKGTKIKREWEDGRRREQETKGKWENGTRKGEEGPVDEDEGSGPAGWCPWGTTEKNVGRRRHASEDTQGKPKADGDQEEKGDAGKERDKDAGKERNKDAS
ncbi:hypothetical protein NDU88_004503 [Pleurodeles waltl]|uniref:Uncharacterized protein n=1 Tax=Pleurodeles waltl TaxID=8319 RepID=A0AAV7V376_PLEWA|nr:hypothetical protein NDU88_004503 [Pleurodeles waltl]